MAELKPVLKNYLSIKQTIEYLNIHGLLNYTANDLYDLAVENKVTPVFLVHDKEVIYSDIDNLVHWLTFTGYCKCPLSIFKFLCDRNLPDSLDELIVHSVIKPKNDSMSLYGTHTQEDTSLNEWDTVKVKPICKTRFDDSSDEVRGIEIDDYIDCIYLEISDIRFSAHEIESLLQDITTQTEDSLPVQAKESSLSKQKERTYLVIIGALHKLLNQKKGSKEAPFKTKDSLVADIVEANKGIHGISKTNIDDYLKKADNVFEDAKKDID